MTDDGERRAMRAEGADEPAPTGATPADGPATGETCDFCGFTTLSWRKCKLICSNCSQINKSCADL